jgi:hypothetical protein
VTLASRGELFFLFVQTSSQMFLGSENGGALYEWRLRQSFLKRIHFRSWSRSRGMQCAPDRGTRELFANSLKQMDWNFISLRFSNPGNGAIEQS